MGVLTTTALTALTIDTFADITGIPTWATRVTIMYYGIALSSGTVDIISQIGTSGGMVATGYQSSCSVVASTGYTADESVIGFLLGLTGNANDTWVGTQVLRKLSGNTWVSSHNISRAISAIKASCFGNGYVTLGGALDRVRLTSTTGVPTFSGYFNITYE